MTKVIFGPYEPDVASVGMASSAFVQNVFPSKDGYKPMPSLQTFGNALTEPRGLFEATLSDGTAAIFAGTDTGLFRLDTLGLTWDNVSKAGGYALLGTEYWSFVQFGSTVIAVTNNIAPQAFDLVASTSFADLGGNPPAARSVTVVGDFVVLASLTAATATIQWSGLNNATFWTPGRQNSDVQQFPDGGAVMAIAGGEFGLVFQQTAIRRMVFSPGSAEIFDFSVVSRDRGLLTPYAAVQAGAGIFFLSQDGFYRTDETGTLVPIGSGRVNDTFFADANLDASRNVIAIADTKSQRVFWFYKTKMGVVSGFDAVMIYDWNLDRWSHALLGVAFAASIAKPGFTLETLDQVSASLETLPQSLDLYTSGEILSLAVMDASGTLAFFTGAPLEAILETPEGNLGGALRTFVKGAAPIGDAATALLSLWKRDRLVDNRVQTAETGLGITGFAPQRSNARFHTGRLRIPAGSAWSFVRGIDVDAVAAGKR